MKCYLIPLLLYFSSVEAGIFKWTDEQGNVHYGDCEDASCPSSENETGRQQMKMEDESLTILPTPTIKPSSSLNEGDASKITKPSKKLTSKLTSEVIPFKCDAPSKQYLGESFDELSDEVNVKAFSKKTYTLAKEMLRLHKGEWKLTIIESECKGKGERSRIETKELAGYVDVSSPDVDVVMLQTDELSNEATRKSYTSLIQWWHVHPQGFWFGDKTTNEYQSKQWQAEIVSATENEFKFFRRSRVGSKQQIRYLALYSLRKGYKQYVIEELSFINHRLSGRKVWQLKR